MPPAFSLVFNRYQCQCNVWTYKEIYIFNESIVLNVCVYTYLQHSDILWRGKHIKQHLPEKRSKTNIKYLQSNKMIFTSYMNKLYPRLRSITFFKSNLVLVVCICHFWKQNISHQKLEFVHFDFHLTALNVVGSYTGPDIRKYMAVSTRISATTSWIHVDLRELII